MPLREEFEATGNWLFKWRGQLPILLYIALFVLLYLQPNEQFAPFTNTYWSIFCLLVNLTGLGFRAYTIGHTPKNTSGRNTEAQLADSLNTKGIYSIVRHPLYVGNYLMWLGLLLYAGNISFALIVSLLYWLYYERIMFAEEAFLRKKFGQQYISWASQVPSFIPTFSRWQTSDLVFSWKNIFKREYTGLLVTVVSFAFINGYKHYQQAGVWQLDTFWLVVLIVGIIVALSLRTIKKRSNYFDVQGR